MSVEVRSLFPLLCSSCHQPLPATLCSAETPFRCPHCGIKLQADIFPAILQPLHEKGSIGTDVADGEASCFYHPDKQAAKVCSSCGRFVCALCEIELVGRCLCPVCLEQGRQNDQISELVTKRTLYDSMALSLSLLPLLIWPITLVTAPVAFFLAIYGWRKPTSILPRTRIRLIAALLFSTLQLIGWGTLAFYLFERWS